MSHREVDPRVLGAMVTMTSENDRYAIGCVRVESTQMIATDGKLLAVFNDRAEYAFGSESTIADPVLLPAKDVKASLKAIKPKKDENPLILLQPNGGTKFYASSTAKRSDLDNPPEKKVQTEIRLEVDGNFPDYKSIMQDLPSQTETIRMSVDLLRKALDAMADMGVEIVSLHFAKTEDGKTPGCKPLVMESTGAAERVWKKGKAVDCPPCPKGKIVLMPCA